MCADCPWQRMSTRSTCQEEYACVHRYGFSSSKCSVSHHCRCEAMSGLSWLKSINDWDRVSDKLVLYNKNTFLRKILQSQCRKDTGMITHPGKTLGKVQHVASRSHNAMDQHTCWGWSTNATLGAPLDLLKCKNRYTEQPLRSTSLTAIVH